MKMMTRAFLATMLAIGGFGCGDDDGDDDVDMYTPPVDMGPEVDMFEEEDDMGPEEDMFVPPEVVNVRIAHLVPDAPNVRLCIGPPGARLALDPQPSIEERADGIPFRAVGGYISLPLRSYEARVFAVDDIDGTEAQDCTIDTDPLLTIDVDAADLVSGNYYTVAAIGFVTPGDFDCPASPTTTTPCGDDKAARLVIEDDSDVDADNALIRVMHAIPNAPNVDICYDPDGADNDTEDPVEIFEDVAFGDMTDYNVQAADLTAGSFRIYVHVDAALDCPTFGDTGDVFDPEIYELTIPTDGDIVANFGPDGAGLPVVDESYDTGSVHTIFAEGVSGVEAPDDGFAAFLPLIDLPAAAP